MKLSGSILLALAAATANAAPRPPGTPEYDPYLQTVEDLCEGWDLSTPDGAKFAWQKSFAATSLGVFLDKGAYARDSPERWANQRNWLTRLEDYVASGISGTPGAANCGLLSSTDCNPLHGMTCQQHFEKGGDDRIKKSSYWIFAAIKGMRSKFSVVSEYVHRDATITNAEVDQMIADFGGEDKGAADIMGWLAAATTMAGSVAGVVPGGGPAAGGFGIMTAAFSGAALGGPEKFNTASLKAGLADLFKAATDSIDRTIRAATGSSTIGAEYDALGQGDTHDYPVEKFFGTGWFLINNNSPAVTDVLNSIKGNMERKMASTIMGTAGIRLVADKDKDTPEKCGTEITGRQWLEVDGKGHCFYLMVTGAEGHHDRYQEAPLEVYQAMERYGLGNRVPFYLANVDCAKNGGEEKKLDLGSLQENKVPTCFFNLPTYYYWWDTCFDSTPKKNCDSRRYEPFN